MSDLYLVDFTAKDILKELNSRGVGRGLKAAGELDSQVVAACADLTDSTQMSLFRDAFPEKFIEIGIAEQNLVTVGAGLAAMGKIPFVSSYAAFSPGRNWEQIRTTICRDRRMDADLVPVQEFADASGGGYVRPGRCRLGNAIARRHEPGRQRIRRLQARPRRSTYS